MSNIERRTFTGTLRRVAEGRKLEGYAAVFNSETVIGSWFREFIAPGAFRESLSRPDDIRALFNHNENYVLGRNSAGTLKLEEDETGLRYVVDLPMTTYANDLLAVIERGDVSQSSFAFQVESSKDEEWDDAPVKQGKLPIRKIVRAKLFDVSPVTFPAYASSSVGARAEQRAKELLGREYRVVCGNVSMEMAPLDTEWSAPTLSDFTDMGWGDLSDAEKRKIAKHYTWAESMPPESFADMKLPHHRPNDGMIVMRGVMAAAGRMNQAGIPDAEMDGVKAHLRKHYEASEMPMDDMPDMLRSAEEIAGRARRQRAWLRLRLAEAE